MQIEGLSMNAYFASFHFWGGVSVWFAIYANIL